ncbi:ATP-binding protein [Kitasatospora terrestris]|uniref:ATP-binding protein n=1 Tax=Kitasatospora terrestris TaxID=258051 RepID=A0ABP9DGK9_9ACTN
MTTTIAPEPLAEPWARPVSAVSWSACAMAPSAACVPSMRHFVRSCVRRLRLAEEVCDTACLVVSELVTNAVLHSGSHSVTVMVHFGGSELVVAVRDDGHWLERTRPRANRADHSATCGRGLDLVRAVSDDCAVDAGPDGTLISALVRIDGSTTAEEAA